MRKLKLCVYRKKSDLNGLSFMRSDQRGRNQQGGDYERRANLSFLTTHVPRGEKPTVAGGVDAFQKGTLGLEADDAVPLAVEHFQLGEDTGIELCKPVIPYVQLGHMPEQVRLIWDHTGDLIQPDRVKQRLSCTGEDLSSISRNISQNMCMFLWSPCVTDGNLFFLFVHTVQLKHYF